MSSEKRNSAYKDHTVRLNYGENYGDKNYGDSNRN